MVTDKKIVKKKPKIKLSKSFKKKKFDEFKATQDMEKLVKNLFKKMDKLVENDWGKPCKDYYWRCISCRIWDVYNRFKRNLELEYLRKNE